MIFDHSIKSDAEILGDKFISPIIAVCVTYFHPGSITRHQTGVLWRLGLDKGVTGEMMIDISKEDWWNDRNLRVFEGHQHIAT